MKKDIIQFFNSKFLYEIIIKNLAALYFKSKWEKFFFEYTLKSHCNEGVIIKGTVIIIIYIM